MADIADQTPSHRLNLVKLHSHLIETQGKLREFIFAVDLHPFIVTSVSNTLRGDGHGMYGRDDTAAEKKAKDDSDKHCCEGGIHQRFIETGTEIKIEL